MTAPYRLIGSTPSPYSNKLRALLRYRRIAHVWVPRSAAVEDEIAHVKPQLVPMLRFPDEADYRVDSTPLAHALEARHPERSVIPADPGEAFLCHLIEDFADEWLTKIMFHYRWFYEADADFAQAWIVDEHQPGADEIRRAQAMAYMRQRQQGRMALVGCTPENAPIIEESFQDLLAALEPHLHGAAFLFGSRPSLADFALYGQLKMLATDPTPQAILREKAPRLDLWLRAVDDASGVEGDWRAPESEPSPVVAALLALVGRDYLPFLAANARAWENGDEEMALTLRGRRYAQAPFRYQLKCLNTLREAFAGLDVASRQRIAPWLEAAGCLEVLDAQGVPA